MAHISIDVKIKNTLYLLVLLFLYSCQNNTNENRSDLSKKSTSVLDTSNNQVTKPSPVLHFWDQFEFSDTTLIQNENYTEQEFVNFLPVIYPVDQKSRKEGIDILLTRALQGHPKMFVHIIRLAERYLYDPNSPYRNEEMYLPFLEFTANIHQPDISEKTRARLVLKTVMKNRPDSIATNFTYILPDKTKRKLHEVKSDYTLLFFNNPTCSDCKRVKEILLQTPLFAQNPVLKVVSIYPDEDLKIWIEADKPQNWINGYSQEIRDQELYDLRAIPTLYLLDREKKVILKDAPIELIGEWLINAK